MQLYGDSMDKEDVIRSLVVLSLLVATQLSATTVYRTVDEKGNAQYSDRPDGGNTETLTIRTAPPSADPPAVAAADSAEQTKAASDTGDDVQGPSPEQQAEQAARQAARRAENCETARGRVERYAISHRLYRTLPNGEREYLSDAEIDAARTRADADVKEWCD